MLCEHANRTCCNQNNLQTCLIVTKHTFRRERKLLQSEQCANMSDVTKQIR
jgi:hypothetical protein